MQRKLLLIIGVAVVLTLLFLTGYSLKETVARKSKANATVKSIPLNKLIALDSGVFDLPRRAAVVLIFFNSECDHCQYELGELKKEIKSFDDTEIVLLSSEYISVLKEVSSGFGQFPNVHFAKIEKDQVYDTFGSLSVPHIFIYGEDRVLIKELKGEIKMEAILKYLSV